MFERKEVQAIAARQTRRVGGLPPALSARGTRGVGGASLCWQPPSPAEKQYGARSGILALGYLHGHAAGATNVHIPASQSSSQLPGGRGGGGGFRSNRDEGALQASGPLPPPSPSLDSFSEYNVRPEATSECTGNFLEYLPGRDDDDGCDGDAGLPRASSKKSPAHARSSKANPAASSSRRGGRGKALSSASSLHRKGNANKGAVPSPSTKKKKKQIETKKKKKTDNNDHGARKQPTGTPALGEDDEEESQHSGRHQQKAAPSASGAPPSSSFLNKQQQRLNAPPIHKGCKVVRNCESGMRLVYLWL
eukprot:jgi/Bigna1/70640/fgenesh1_pg.12_\